MTTTTYLSNDDSHNNTFQTDNITFTGPRHSHNKNSTTQPQPPTMVSVSSAPPSNTIRGELGTPGQTNLNRHTRHNDVLAPVF
ncbi:MAG: hypothetical protein [Cressdnaviricota sp.]|nr:MAG: hypothetical protein [Cressdnaviricota sp.]